MKVLPVIPYGPSRRSWISKLFGLLGPANDDVQQTSRKIPLLDCVSSKRMTMPCRSIHCGHVECFDYPIWFALRAQGHPKCPICRKFLTIDDLFIDGFLEDVLLKCEEDYFLFNSDGSWKADSAIVPTHIEIITDYEFDDCPDLDIDLNLPIDPTRTYEVPKETPPLVAVKVEPQDEQPNGAIDAPEPQKRASQEQDREWEQKLSEMRGERRPRPPIIERATKRPRVEDPPSSNGLCQSEGSTSSHSSNPTKPTWDKAVNRCHFWEASTCPTDDCLFLHDTSPTSWNCVECKANNPQTEIKCWRCDVFRPSHEYMNSHKYQVNIKQSQKQGVNKNNAQRNSTAQLRSSTENQALQDKEDALRAALEKMMKKNLQQKNQPATKSTHQPQKKAPSSSTNQPKKAHSKRSQNSHHESHAQKNTQLHSSGPGHKDSRKPTHLKSSNDSRQSNNAQPHSSSSRPLSSSGPNHQNRHLRGSQNSSHLPYPPHPSNDLGSSNNQSQPPQYQQNPQSLHPPQNYHRYPSPQPSYPPPNYPHQAYQPPYPEPPRYISPQPYHQPHPHPHYPPQPAHHHLPHPPHPHQAYPQHHYPQHFPPQYYPEQTYQQPYPPHGQHPGYLGYFY